MSSCVFSMNYECISLVIYPLERHLLHTCLARERSLLSAVFLKISSIFLSDQIFCLTLKMLWSKSRSYFQKKLSSLFQDLCTFNFILFLTKVFAKMQGKWWYLQFFSCYTTEQHFGLSRQQRGNPYFSVSRKTFGLNMYINYIMEQEHSSIQL